MLQWYNSQWWEVFVIGGVSKKTRHIFFRHDCPQSGCTDKICGRLSILVTSCGQSIRSTRHVRTPTLCSPPPPTLPLPISPWCDIPFRPKMGITFPESKQYPLFPVGIEWWCSYLPLGCCSGGTLLASRFGTFLLGQPYVKLNDDWVPQYIVYWPTYEGREERVIFSDHFLPQSCHNLRKDHFLATFHNKICLPQWIPPTPLFLFLPETSTVTIIHPRTWMLPMEPIILVLKMTMTAASASTTTSKQRTKKTNRVQEQLDNKSTTSRVSTLKKLGGSITSALRYGYAGITHAAASCRTLVEPGYLKTYHVDSKAFGLMHQT